MIELGKALSQARVARGLTLHDVERDTRISQRYIQALENEEFEAMPAPVYTRAFLRTYAQYLGLSAPTLMQRLPGARPEPELPPLPAIERPAAPATNASWLIGGVVLVVLLGAGLLFMVGRSGGGSTTPDDASSEVGQGAESNAPVDTSPEIEPGQVPALEGQQLTVALEALQSLQLTYVIVELDSDDPEGTVFSQSPSGGTAAAAGSTVTLMVSR
jgi:cytoskeletal protein RodZ